MTRITRISAAVVFDPSTLIREDKCPARRREARERLRLAVRDAKKDPELVKSHKPGLAWEWPKGSPALKEVRAALMT